MKGLNRNSLSAIVEGLYYSDKIFPLFLGDRGLGKTAFAEDIAQVIAEYHLPRKIFKTEKTLTELIYNFWKNTKEEETKIKMLNDLLQLYSKKDKGLYKFSRDLLDKLSKVEDTDIKAGVIDNNLVKFVKTLKKVLVQVIPTSHIKPDDIIFFLPDVETKQLEILPLMLSPYSIIILDELTNANQEVQSFLMSFILSKRIYTLQYEGVFFIATGNRPEQSSVATNLASPLLERFAIFDYPQISWEELIALLMSKFKHNYIACGVHIPLLIEMIAKEQRSFPIYEPMTAEDEMAFRRKKSPRGFEQFITSAISLYDRKGEESLPLLVNLWESILGEPQEVDKNFIKTLQKVLGDTGVIKDLQKQWEAISDILYKAYKYEELSDFWFAIEKNEKEIEQVKQVLDEIAESNLKIFTPFAIKTDTNLSHLFDEKTNEKAKEVLKVFYWTQIRLFRNKFWEFVAKYWGYDEWKEVDNLLGTTTTEQTEKDSLSQTEVLYISSEEIEKFLKSLGT